MSIKTLKVVWNCLGGWWYSWRNAVTQK